MSKMELLEKNARDFMLKRLSNENRIRNKTVSELRKLFKQIIAAFKSYDKINVSYLPIIMENEVRPFVNSYKETFMRIMEDSIINHFEEGYRNAGRLLEIASGESILISENEIEIEDESTKEEIISLLLLYSEKLIENLTDDLLKKIESDITSIYITSINKDDNNAINTISSGAIISGYINSTLNNITNRVDSISRTETNRALNSGGLLYYLRASNQIQGLLVRWVEVPDTRLCRFCKSMAESGTRYGIGVYHINDIQPPPLHPRCRCILAPYHRSWN